MKVRTQTKLKDNISRNEFLKKLGITGGALLAVYGLGVLSSCSEKDTTAGPKDFTISLDDATYSNLRTVGNFQVVNDVVIVYTATNAYVAVTRICSHEGEKKVTYRKSTNDFYCSEHGATFSIAGKGTNSNGSKGLKMYSTSLSGNALRIFGS